MVDPNRILKQIQPLLAKQSTVWVGFSGGLDSTVLLDAISRLNLPCALKAVHINHRLSPGAGAWEQHCIAHAAQLGVALRVERVDVAPAGRGLEEAARQQRYAVFETILAERDVLLLAHHLDDQAETLVFRLVRGAGVKGLAGIRRQRTLGKGQLLRPLLDVARADLLAYAQQHDLRWIEDESNSDTDFDRNFIRHKILPVFAARWPNFRASLGRALDWLGEADALLSAYANEDLQRCDQREERLGQSIALQPYAALSTARQKHVLRHWVSAGNYTLPDSAQLQQVASLLKAREDAEPVLAWGRCELRRFKNRLYLLPRLRETQAEGAGGIRWHGGAPLNLPDGSCLERLSGDAACGLVVAFRAGGERCRPLAREHSQTLKKLLQEYQLEPWLRARVPLIYLNNQLIAVGDLFRCLGCPPELQFRWRYSLG